MIYDDIIVGAGSSGAVLAARLSEDRRRRVLLLEAGPDYASVETTPRDLTDSTWISVARHDWGFRAEAVKGRDVEFPRGKVTGGSSAVNATIALRGAPADYDEWASLGNDEWAWERVLPFFCVLEDDQDAGGALHGRGGPIPIRRWRDGELVPLQAAFRDVTRALGVPAVTDHNHPDARGVGPWPMNQRERLRVSTAVAYLLPARARENLSIRAGCLARRLVVDGGRAVGVEVEQGGLPEVVRGRRVTLAAGTIGSPAILLRSGVGPRTELAALGIEPLVDVPGVGANLIDHPLASVALVPRPGVCARTQPVVQIGARLTAPGSSEANDLQMFMVSHADLTEIPSAMALVGAPTVFAVAVSLQRPRSRGRVSLVGPDPHAAPRIELNYLDDGEDMRRMVDGLRLAWRVAEHAAIRDSADRIAILTEEMMGVDEVVQGYLRMAVSTLYHPVGTARMGPADDAGAVVDQYGRVRGLDGVRVLDASIMPNIPRANTNLTCIMLAERAAGWLREG